MALDSKNNIKSVFIVPSQAAVTTGTAVPGNFATGSVVVTNVSNEVLDLSTVLNYSTIKIVKDRGANLPLQQVRLNIADIIAYSGACYEPADEQETFIGYNGTSGSITVANDSFYEVKLEHVPNAFAYGKRPANYKYGTFKSDATNATQLEIANGIVASLVQNFKPNRTIDWRVYVEAVTSASKIAAGSAGTLTFTKWSKTVVASATTATDALAVGDYISIGTATTNGVYEITAIDIATGNLTLSVAYNGDTVSGIVSTGTIAVTAAAAAGATRWGIKITGIKQKYDVNRWRQYDKVRFNPFINEPFAGTLVTTTAAFDGVGVYEQAANDEYISWGDEGQVFVDQVPPLFREQDADPNGTYYIAILGWLNKLPSLIGAGENKGSAIFYMEDPCDTGDQAYTLLGILDEWVSNAYLTIPKLSGTGVIGTCCG